MGQTGCLCILLYCIYIISACPLSTRLPSHKTSPKQLLDVSSHGFDTDKVSALLPPIICPCVTPQCSTHVHDIYLSLSVLSCADHTIDPEYDMSALTLFGSRPWVKRPNGGFI